MLARKCFLVAFILLCIINLSAQDQFLKALSLDGNKNYMEVPHNDIFNLGKAYTIEFWIYDNIGAPAAIINKWSVMNSIHITDDIWVVYHRGWLIDINQKRSLWTPGTIPSPGYGNSPFDDFEPYPGVLDFTMAHIHADGIGGGNSSHGKYNAIITGKWIHIAITVNLDSTRSYFYINGERGSSSGTASLERDYNTPGYPLHIGGFPVTVDSTLYLNGLLDEVRIWNIERSASQIQKTMKDPLSQEYCLTADSGLVLYYRFDQLENLGIGEDGLADDIRDLSFYQNHGDIIGSANLAVSDIVTGVESKPIDRPVAFDLLQNYPNPFNASTTIRFHLSKMSPVKLTIYNIRGEEIETLIQDVMPQGVHDIVWDAQGYASGIYFSRLETEGYVETLKMVLQQ